MINIFIGWLMAIHYHMPMLCLPCSAFISGSIYLIFDRYLLITKINPMYKVDISWELYKENFVKFFIFGVYCILFTNLLFLGAECNVYFAGLIHDDIELASFVSWSNTCLITWIIAVGFAGKARSNVAYLYGANEISEAKLLSEFNYLILLATGIIEAALMYFFRSYIARIYSNHPEVLARLEI